MKKTEEKPVPNIVRVTWLDIVDDNEWQSKEKVDKSTPCTCVSVGFLYSRDKNTIKIVKTFANDLREPYGDLLTIPMGCVKDVKVLTTKKLRRGK